MQPIPQIIRSARQAKGLSRARAAERAGINPRTMEAYEQGRIQPDMATLDHIMRALGHTIEFQVQQFHPYSGDVDALAAQWGWFMTDAGAGSTEEWHTPEGDLRAWRLPSGETWVHPDFAPVN